MQICCVPCLAFRFINFVPSSPTLTSTKEAVGYQLRRRPYPADRLPGGPTSLTINYEVSKHTGISTDARIGIFGTEKARQNRC